MTMKTLIKKTLFAAVMASAFSMPVGATSLTLTTDGLWHSFDVDDASALSGGVEWIDAQSDTGYANDGSALHFTFTLLDFAMLTVVDGGFAGDQFQVFDNGISLGFTSNPTNNYPTSVATDFDAALVNPLYSSAVFYLAAGQHDITGLLSASAPVNSIPLNATLGAVSLSSVTEPSTFGLLLAGGGLILIGFCSRRRTN